MIEFINPFISSTFGLFRTMLNCELERGEPSVNDHFQPQHEVSGVIGLSGDISGTAIVSLSQEVALHATEALLGYLPESVNEDVVDAVGELTNMIAGSAKAELNLGQVCLALPAVITGANHVIAFGSRIKPVLIPFTTPWGPMSIEVGFVETPALKEALERKRQEAKDAQTDDPGLLNSL